MLIMARTLYLAGSQVKEGAYLGNSKLPQPVISNNFKKKFYINRVRYLQKSNVMMLNLGILVVFHLYHVAKSI